jgi:hypothetical protein
MENKQAVGIKEITDTELHRILAESNEITLRQRGQSFWSALREALDWMYHQGFCFGYRFTHAVAGPDSRRESKPKSC